MTQKPFEVVVINKKYLRNLDDLTPLFKFINKSYDKARFKFDIITTQRVKSPSSFKDDFHIDENPDFLLFILLAPQGVIDPSTRPFRNSNNLEEAFDCDIPPELYDQLKFTGDVEIKVAYEGYDLSMDLHRILASCAYGLTEISESEIAAELTAVTSFMRKLGSKYLEFTITNFFQNSKFIDYLDPLITLPEKLTAVKIMSNVVRQHKLVTYYCLRCLFIESGEPDFIVKVEDLDSGPFEKGIVANSDFSIAFLERRIYILAN